MLAAHEKVVNRDNGENDAQARQRIACFKDEEQHCQYSSDYYVNGWQERVTQGFVRAGEVRAFAAQAINAQNGKNVKDKNAEYDQRQ